MVKAKAAAASFVIPQNRDEARDMLAKYGEANRQVERIATNLKTELAAAKRAAVEEAVPFARAADEYFKGLQAFCEANRAALTDSGKTKTVDLGTGKASWRSNPAAVNLTGKVEDIIKRIKDAGEGYMKFLRPSVEVNRVAMLNDPNLANKIKGVKVEAAGETFSIEAFAEDEQLREAV